MVDENVPDDKFKSSKNLKSTLPILLFNADIFSFIYETIAKRNTVNTIIFRFFREQLKNRK